MATSMQTQFSGSESTPIRRSRHTRGQATVEMALAVPIFFLILVGMVEYGRALMMRHTMTDAAREGARLAALMNADATDVESTVSDLLLSGGLTLSQANVTITGTNASTGGNASVAITYPYQSIVLGLIHFSSDTVTLSVQSTVVHE
ncbi:MAG: pilus assembly protein [Acidobacteria bacterium]|nr:pilus assembly protein [Acidobacteriota bacterium]